MKRSPMPPRKAPFRATKPMATGGPPKRFTELSRQAVKPRSKPLPYRPAPMSPEEKQARALVGARSSGICERCGQARATNFHHRQNRGRGKVGKWTAENGMHLCGSGTTGCHGEITAKPAWARSHGWSVLSTQHPASVPARLYGRGLVYLDADGGVTPVAERSVA